MKEDRTKKPPGWKVRVGAGGGNAQFDVHYQMPSGFRFTNTLTHFDGSSRKDLAIEQAWVHADNAKKLEESRKRHTLFCCNLGEESEILERVDQDRFS